MTKKTIPTYFNKEGEIYLEYDETEYEIEELHHQRKFILKRVKDGQILHVFEDNLAFIIEEAKENNQNPDNFIVSQTDKNNKSEILHYEAYGYKNKLLLKKSIPVSNLKYEGIRIKKGLYVIDDSYYSSTHLLYNLKDIKTVKESYVYPNFSKSVSKILGDNVIMVRDVIGPVRGVSDTITYGIDSKTFSIVTPIWSDLQQRFINILTEEDIKNKKIPEYLKGLSCEDLTMREEVKKYIEKLADYLDEIEKQNESKYTDTEFIMKFKQKKENN